ncbi:sce7726 family protein [Pseudomonas stutzeri]|uniref:sce7726 family protein n=1 Tax=Stutzerimonas stutzeri TaxID=316 RepID=UPI00210F2058|nr:sce7726 family protein [Stutzerimonas stutzeri]MCQ4313910.1 sce7726 family protein [Stutzerimonas stutzeri]
MSMTLKTFNNTQQSAIARLFSATVLRELADKGRSPLFSRLLLESHLLDELKLSDSVSTVFDTAFDVLRKKAYRTEYAYKSAIASKLLLGRHSLKTASLLTEFRVETCKVDVAIFNGTATAYEIKSERDRLDRLENQINSYRKVFSKVYVVTGDNHVEEVTRRTEEDVGVLLLSSRFTISTVREAVDRPELIQPEIIFDSLKLKEATSLLAEFGITPPNVPNTETHRTLRDIFRDLDPIETHKKMVSVMRHSRSSHTLAGFLSELPQSLVAAIISAPIKEKDQPKLLRAINTQIGEALAWA